MCDDLWSPIIIIGAARSGTTLLAETILSQHPTIAYWNEPSYVWRSGYAYRPSDVLRQTDVTPEVARRIRARFARFVGESDGSRLMTKCPENTLQMPFVLKVFPAAQIVHIIRDGRDVAMSAAREWKGAGETALDSAAQRQAALPIRLVKMLRSELNLSNRVHSWRDIVELPAYARRFWHFLRRHLTGASHLPWGPRFPGLEAVRRTYSLLETTAFQWDVCVRSAWNACRTLPTTQYREVRYEALINGPRQTVEEVLEFLGFDDRSRLIDDLVHGVVERKVPMWPEALAAEQVEAVELHIAWTLQQLGYPLSESRDFGRC